MKINIRENNIFLLEKNIWILRNKKEEENKKFRIRLRKNNKFLNNNWEIKKKKIFLKILKN
jgi:hypothetical protein